MYIQREIILEEMRLGEANKKRNVKMKQEEVCIWEENKRSHKLNLM